jgi:hypothetical protein
MSEGLLVDTFVEGLGTVRSCLDCDSLVTGGPTRCVRCATDGPPGKSKAKVDYRVIEELFTFCPFCGEKPNVFQVPDDRYGTDFGWVVECKDMGCIFKRSTPNQSFKALMNDWNKRF